LKGCGGGDGAGPEAAGSKHSRARDRRHTSNYKGAAEVVKRKEMNEVDSDGISKKNRVKLLGDFLLNYFSRFLNIKERVQTRDQEVEGRCR